MPPLPDPARAHAPHRDRGQRAVRPDGQGGREAGPVVHLGQPRRGGVRQSRQARHHPRERAAAPRRSATASTAASARGWPSCSCACCSRKCTSGGCGCTSRATSSGCGRTSSTASASSRSRSPSFDAGSAAGCSAVGRRRHDHRPPPAARSCPGSAPRRRPGARRVRQRRRRRPKPGPRALTDAQWRGAS